MNYKVTFRDDSESIEHYGTPGMKWGVRNDYVPMGVPSKIVDQQKAKAIARSPAGIPTKSKAVVATTTPAKTTKKVTKKTTKASTKSKKVVTKSTKKTTKATETDKEYSDTVNSMEDFINKFIGEYDKKKNEEYERQYLNDQSSGKITPPRMQVTSQVQTEIEDILNRLRGKK